MPVARCLAGYRDDDDGVLQGLEAAAESERLKGLVATWETAEAQRRAVDPEGVAAEERDLAGLDRVEGGEGFVAHVVVPDQELIKKAVLARRKQELLAKLAASAEAGVALPEDQPRVEELSSLRRLPPSW